MLMYFLNLISSSLDELHVKYAHVTKGAVAG